MRGFQHSNFFPRDVNPRRQILMTIIGIHPLDPRPPFQWAGSLPFSVVVVGLQQVETRCVVHHLVQLTLSMIMRMVVGSLRI
jgi:hypothetical protein